MTPVFTTKQPEKTARLQRDIKKNLAQFRQYTVAARLDSTYWFSNEYPVGSSYSNVRLFDSFAYIPFPKPLSEYRVAVLTGEGGLFRGFSVLAAKSDMTLQIDCDHSDVLQLSIGRTEKSGDLHRQESGTGKCT